MPDNLQILLVDDDTKRFENFKKALNDQSVASMQDTNWEKSDFKNSNIYTEDNFCNTISELATKDLSELYFYIFKIIEKEKINIIFMDLFLSEKKDNNDRNTGIELVKLLRSNILHKKIPIILHSRGIENSDRIYEKKALEGNALFIPTEKVINDPSALRERIFEKIDFTKLKTDIGQYRQREFDYNLGVLCALPKELKPIADLMDEEPKNIESGDSKTFKSSYMIHKDKAKILKVVYKTPDEAGNLTALSLTQTMIRDFKPQYIAMTGIAGGFKDNVKLGDVVIVRHSFDWQQGKYEGNKFLQRAEPFIIDKSLKHTIKEKFLDDFNDNKFSIEEMTNDFDDIKKINELKQNENIQSFCFRFGPFATGSAVVASERKGKTILEQHDKSGGLDMEIYAIYKAAYESNIGTKAIAIKGIVDYVDEDKGDDWHEFASYASAKTLYKLFMEYIDIEGKC